jgi:hypothetical protein
MTNRYQSGLPVPHQGSYGESHPDGYNNYPIVSNNNNACYGSPGQQSPNGFRVEVSFPNQRPAYNAAAQNSYGAVPDHHGLRGYRSARLQQASRGFAAAASGYYGNPVTIRVSEANWIDALVQAMEQGQGIDLVFDSTEVVNNLVEAVEKEIGSWTSAVERWGRDLWNRIFALGLAYPNPNVPAQALVAPAVIAAIVVVALAIIVAVVAMYNINASRRIAELAMERGCEVIDIEASGEGEGTGSWFSFLVGSNWKIRCGQN